MKIETLLNDTFAAHEHLAADTDEVMASVHRRIEHRPSGLARPLAIAASIAVVATVGVAVGLTRNSGHPAPQSTQQAAERVHTQSAGRSSSGVAPLTMPFDLRWLPAGSATYSARRINTGEVTETSPPVFDGEYLLTVTTANEAIDIDVQQMPGGLAGVHFKSGPGAPVAINGRDGIESTNSGGPGGYEVYFRDSAGGVMYVNAASHAGGTVSAAELTTIGRRVAENVRFPGTTHVEPTFGVGYIPAGLRVRTFDVESPAIDSPLANGMRGPVTAYELGTLTSRESDADLASNAEAPSSAKPGHPVQGHPTRLVDDRGYRTLYVLDAVLGRAVQISSSRLPVSELYKIADGLALPK